MSKSLYCLSGRLGVTNGMDTLAIDMVTEDDDGEIPAGDNHDWIIDISTLLSEQLGKQMPMMATYRVKGIQMSLRNVNNTNDNNYALAYGGSVEWYVPTMHRIDALQYAREFARERGAADSAGLGSPYQKYQGQKYYKGLRFNWDADGQVHGAVNDEIGSLSGTEWDLYNMLNGYNLVLAGTPTGEGYLSDGSGGAALWNTRTGVAEVDSLYFNVAYTNQQFVDKPPDLDGNLRNDTIFAPSFQDWSFEAGANNHLPVLGGLLHVTGFHSNTDNPRFGEVEDDYYIQCTVIVEGWEEF